MGPVTATVYLLCLGLSRELVTNDPVTVDQLLKRRGPMLVVADDAQIEAKRWMLWRGFWPTRAGRLVTSGFRPIETKVQARKLAGKVLIYHSGPDSGRGSHDLVLWGHWMGARMARATPILGNEGPNKVLDPHHLKIRPLPDFLTNPMKVTLVFLDKQGKVRKTTTASIIELRHSFPAK